MLRQRWEWRPFVKEVTEQWSCGGRRLSTDVIFSKTKLCGDEQRNGGVPRDVLDCGGTAALENDSGALWIQSEHDPFLRLSGCAAYCAENWTGEGQGTGSENVMVARGCSRERLQIKSIVSKANKDDLEACGIVVPGEVSKYTVESETELDPD